MKRLMLLAACGLFATSARAADLPFVAVARDRKGFVLDDGKPFVPWGVNYDRDRKGRLIEDYWDDEWATIVEDFGEMQRLGANVVRVHIQLGKFMAAADKPHTRSLERLGRLLELAEKRGLYLDLTGLGCYHRKDVPAWYDALTEQERWAVQARFWEAVAKKCAASPAIFCYDLMNEPVVAGAPRQDWLAGPPLAGKHFVQFITLDAAGRPRPAVARAWIGQLAAAIRRHDRRHLITVGLLPNSLDRKGLTSGFVPEQVAGELDFVCVHLYPEKDKLDEALDILKGFAVGKPVVIEEMFPLRCSMAELEQFVDRSRAHAAGWLGFYWGQTPEELRQSTTLADAVTLAWLEYFARRAKTIGKTP